jgi:3-deoxy-manno-octulosonate cytidylyltransferase (CMP-KDO synthetase)
MIVGIIPARMGSSRFPGKPLANILGKPMIFHVYARCVLSKKLDSLYIATPDTEIFDYCKKESMKCVMTKHSHERCTERTVEAILKIEKKMKKRIKTVVMIQGDEPMVFPDMIDKSVNPILKDNSVNVVNLMSVLETEKEKMDINQVKVVVDKRNNALYFSRSKIPFLRSANNDIYRQLTVISFKRDFLVKFVKMAPTPLEKAESVDMLRILENGYKIKMVPVKNKIYSVDVEADRKKVEKYLKKDKLLKKYIN